MDDQIYLVNENWSGFTLFKNEMIYNINISDSDSEFIDPEMGDEPEAYTKIHIDGWTYRIEGKEKGDYADHPQDFQYDLYPNFRFRLGWI